MFSTRNIYHWWIKQNTMFDVWLDVHMVVSLILKTTDFTKNRKKSPRQKTLISWEEKSILNVFCQAAATRPNSKHSFFLLKGILHQKIFYRLNYSLNTVWTIAWNTGNWRIWSGAVMGGEFGSGQSPHHPPQETPYRKLVFYMNWQECFAVI